MTKIQFVILLDFFPNRILQLAFTGYISQQAQM